jgi:uncharacterized protein YbjT (DUF2867 family)
MTTAVMGATGHIGSEIVRGLALSRFGLGTRRRLSHGARRSPCT